MNIIVPLLLFILPTKMALIILMFNKKVKISSKTYIGFSWIATSDIYMGHCHIGHLNFIHVNGLHMEDGSKIGHLNYICGDFDIIMKKSNIDNQNKFSSTSRSYHKVTLLLDEKSHITTQHLFDLTDSITIGKKTTIAGAGTQIWTHSFLRSKELRKNVRIDSPVMIGDWCYIGSRCNIMPGVNIGEEVSVGTQTLVAKSLNQSGLYVGQGSKFIEIDFKDRILKLGPAKTPNIYRK